MSKPVFAEGVTSPRPRIRTNSPPPSSFRSQLVVVYVVSTSSSFLVVQRNPFSSLVPTPSLFSRSVHVPRRRPAREKNLSREIDCSSKWIDSTPFPPNIFFKGNASSIDPPHQRERTGGFSSRVGKQLLCFFRSLARPRREVFHPDQEGFNLKIPHSEAIRPLTYGSKALDTRAPQYRNRVMNHARYSSRENR